MKTLDSKIAKTLQKINEQSISLKNAIQQISNEDKDFKKITLCVREIAKNQILINSIIDIFFNDLEILNKEKFTVIIYRKFFLNDKLGGKVMNLINNHEESIRKYIDSYKKDELKNKNMLVNVWVF